MARGGKRPGAGRPAGAANARTREIADRASAEGITPLEYMLQILRDDSGDPAVRFEAAKAAAPYMHAKLAAAQISGPDGGPIESNVTVSLDEDTVERIGRGLLGSEG